MRPCAERTWNMLYMFVTLDVFQLDRSASKFCKLRKSSLMSETPETSQSAMGPYVAVAAAGLALNAWTAAFAGLHLHLHEQGCPEDGGPGGQR